MHLPYVGVATVINETNMRNDIVQHATSDLNVGTTDDFDDSWLHLNDSFQRIPMEYTSIVGSGISNNSC